MPRKQGQTTAVRLPDSRQAVLARLRSAETKATYKYRTRKLHPDHQGCNFDLEETVETGKWQSMVVFEFLSGHSSWKSTVEVLYNADNHTSTTLHLKHGERKPGEQILCTVGRLLPNATLKATGIYYV